MERTLLHLNIIRSFHPAIDVVTNNHIDLETWLSETHKAKITDVDVENDECTITFEGDNEDYTASLKWIKHI